MNFSKITGTAVLAVAVLVSTAAFAGNKPGSLYLANGAELNGKTLPAGTYDVRVEGNGPEVQVQFLKGKKLMASAPAKVEQMQKKAYQNAAVIETTGGGRSLIEARFAGKKFKLLFPSPEAQAKAAQSNSGSSQTNP